MKKLSNLFQVPKKNRTKHFLTLRCDLGSQKQKKQNFNDKKMNNEDLTQSAWNDIARVVGQEGAKSTIRQMIEQQEDSAVNRLYEMIEGQLTKVYKCCLVGPFNVLFLIRFFFFCFSSFSFLQQDVIRDVLQRNRNDEDKALGELVEIVDEHKRKEEASRRATQKKKAEAEKRAQQFGELQRRFPFVEVSEQTKNFAQSADYSNYSSTVSVSSKYSRQMSKNS